MPIKKESVEEAAHHRCLCWNATVHAWIGEVGDGTIVVLSANRYQDHVRAYLVTRGIEWKSWAEYQREAQREQQGEEQGKAQEAWQRQCHEEDVLRANLTWWQQLAQHADDAELRLWSFPTQGGPQAICYLPS